MVNAGVLAVAIAINVFGCVIAMMGLIVPVMNARRPAPRKAAAVPVMYARRPAPRKAAAVRLTVVPAPVPSLDEQPSVRPAPLVRASGGDVRSGGLRAA